MLRLQKAAARLDHVLQLPRTTYDAFYFNCVGIYVVERAIINPLRLGENPRKAWVGGA